MKRLCILFGLLLAITACAPKKAVEYTVADTVFTYDGTSYNLTEWEPIVNAITEVLPVGDETRLVIEGHTGPKNNVYFVFNKSTREFEAQFPGVCLTWRDNDITTAMYAYWSDILDYEGNVIAALELAEGESVSDLAFSEDGTALTVTIQQDETERQVAVDL